MTTSQSLLIAQLTDTHLFANEFQEMLNCPTGQSFRSVVERVNSWVPRPDILLLTGDLSQDETPESYEQLRSLLTPLEIPTYWIPGNHDNLPTMQAILRDQWISPIRSFQRQGWQVILLSSLVPGCVDGELSTEDLGWLDRQLEAVRLPTLVALHHPPIAIASEWMDGIGLRNSEALYEVLDRHPQVKIVLFGHIHQEFVGERNGVTYLGSPSTCVQFKPLRREFTVDELQPGFRLLKLDPDGQFATQVERVLTGEGQARMKSN